MKREGKDKSGQGLEVPVSRGRDSGSWLGTEARLWGVADLQVEGRKACSNGGFQKPFLKKKTKIKSLVLITQGDKSNAT